MRWLHNSKELDQEQGRNDIGQRGHILGLAGEHLDDGIGDHGQTDAVADGAGDGHGQQHDEHGNDLIHIIEIHVFQALQHQDTHIDQGGGGGGSGNDGGDRRDKHAGQEHKGGGEGGQTGAAAGLNTGGGLHEGGDGGCTAAGAEDVEADGPVFEVTTDPDSFNDVVKALEEKGYTFESAEIEMVPQNYVTMTNEDDVRSMTKLLDMLEENEDVQNVWHNWQQE